MSMQCSQVDPLLLPSSLSSSLSPAECGKEQSISHSCNPDNVLHSKVLEAHLWVSTCPYLFATVQHRSFLQSKNK